MVQSFKANNDGDPSFQAKECEITRQAKETSIGEKNCIRIDTKNCGNGAVTCKIKSHDGK